MPNLVQIVFFVRGSKYGGRIRGLIIHVQVMPGTRQIALKNLTDEMPVTSGLTTVQSRVSNCDTGNSTQRAALIQCRKGRPRIPMALRWRPRLRCHRDRGLPMLSATCSGPCDGGPGPGTRSGPERRAVLPQTIFWLRLCARRCAWPIVPACQSGNDTSQFDLLTDFTASAFPVLRAVRSARGLAGFFGRHGKRAQDHQVPSSAKLPVLSV